MTAVADTGTRTCRSGIRVSAHDLAAWLVANWWRLRWESQGEGASWKMSHRVGAAGNGHLWPDLEFVGGESTVQIRSNPVSLGTTSPLRLLSEVDVHVPVADFEDGVGNFVWAVTSRSQSLPLQGRDDLHELAAAGRDLGEEVKDPELSLERSLEARRGFDPEEADPALLVGLPQAVPKVGRGPVEELTDSSKSLALKDLETVRGDMRTLSRHMRLGITSGITDAVVRVKSRDLRPWKKGSALADVVRREWSIHSDATDNQCLAELREVSQDWTRTGLDDDISIPIGFRKAGDEDRLLASLKKRHRTGRRFALARIIGDHLLAGADDRMLPVTDAVTDPQRFQRAFAQAFLCPFDARSDHLGSKVPDDDFIEDAAQHFNVSSLLVRSTLINHGVLRPAALAS